MSSDLFTLKGGGRVRPTRSVHGCALCYLNLFMAPLNTTDEKTKSSFLLEWCSRFSLVYRTWAFPLASEIHWKGVKGPPYIAGSDILQQLPFAGRCLSLYCAINSQGSKSGPEVSVVFWVRTWGHGRMEKDVRKRGEKLKIILSLINLRVQVSYSLRYFNTGVSISFSPGATSTSQLPSKGRL